MFVPFGQRVILPEGSEPIERGKGWELWINRIMARTYYIRRVVNGYEVTELPGVRNITRNLGLFNSYAAQRQRTACGSCS